ncbi:ADP-ribosylation factor-like protein 15 isoform X3 [Pseudoliparis swirei]|uniref:ADP-ribosylation factor-like protein 15 isoform X3 n=1 Tax=Pseudoliparis swirei TaxID=2059687 RepID=UPI0024BF00E4|nr:ADP-ribosylation factor-like protein 15 isoform X3 [Pseudoliparis swirei]
MVLRLTSDTADEREAGPQSQVVIHGVTGLPPVATRAQLDGCFRALCCKGPPPPRPEYDVVCIGLTGAGKTSLLSRLCSEGNGGVGPTTGFSIKAVPFPNAILNVKELGGADNIKKYWSRYYQGSQGVVFVLDSASSDEDLEAARNELHSALQHPQLCTLPFLILANHQDKPAARTPSQNPDSTLRFFFRAAVRAGVHNSRPMGRCHRPQGEGHDGGDHVTVQNSALRPLAAPILHKL